MRAVIQRSGPAEVVVNGAVTARIERGAVVLLAVARDDTPQEAAWLAAKISRLRIYNDEAGRMNASLADVGGDFLVISQFTLYGDSRKGNRPSYMESAPPEQAKVLYEEFVASLRHCGHRVVTGSFQAQMKVRLENDGPVTLIIERRAAGISSTAR